MVGVLINIADKVGGYLRIHMRLRLLMFFCLMLIYMESILKVSVFKNLFDRGFLYMALFSVPAGAIMYLLSTLFKELSLIHI